MQFTEARFNLFLLGLIVGLFGTTFILNGILLPAALLLGAILVLMFIIKYRTSTRQDLAYLLSGVAIAALLCVLVPVLSPITLTVPLLIIVSVLILLIVKP